MSKSESAETKHLENEDEDESANEKLKELLTALLRQRKLRPTTTRVSNAPVQDENDDEEEEGEFSDQEDEVDTPTPKPQEKKQKYWTSKRIFIYTITAAYVAASYGLINMTLLSNKTYHYSSFLIMRLMGVMWLLSFVSLSVQIHGLIGEDGILSVSDTMSVFRRNRRTIWTHPTLFWYRNDDQFIKLLYQIGIASSIMITLNIFPVINLAVCFICFLSFRQVGREFFALQFDSLLLEVTSLLFLLQARTPLSFLHWFPSFNEPSHSILWATSWLAFRLNFCSGVLKLMTGDKAWGSGRALLYHYWSQPMPSWISYYAHWAFPEKFHIFSCYMHFFIEIGVPFGLFFDFTRFYAAVGLIGFQFAILITGNYGVFNWLTALLCLGSVDDSYFSTVFQFFGANPSVPGTTSWTNFADYVLSTPPRDLLTISNVIGLACFAYAVTLLALSYVPICMISKGKYYPPNTLYSWYGTFQDYSLINYYGLFGSMTTFRHEVIIEASNDGQIWQPYEFLYKPGDPSRKPRWVTGHLPRLDWRLWFLPFDRNRPVAEPPANWFLMVLFQLLKASPSVLGIIESAPFGTERPKYLRTSVWDYKFEEPKRTKETGLWWHRQFLRPFSLILTLEQDKIVFLPATTELPKSMGTSSIRSK